MMILCDMCNMSLEQPINKNKFFLNDYVEGMGFLFWFLQRRRNPPLFDVPKESN